MLLNRIALIIATLVISAPAFAADKVQCYGLLFDSETNDVLRLAAATPFEIELAEEGRSYVIATLPNYVVRVLRFRGSGVNKAEELYLELAFNPSSGKSLPRKEIVIDGNRATIGSVNRLGNSTGQFDGTRVALQYESSAVYASFNCSRVVPPLPVPQPEPIPAPQQPTEPPSESPELN